MNEAEALNESERIQYLLSRLAICTSRTLTDIGNRREEKKIKKTSKGEPEVKRR